MLFSYLHLLLVCHCLGLALSSPRRAPRAVFDLIPETTTRPARPGQLSDYRRFLHRQGGGRDRMTRKRRRRRMRTLFLRWLREEMEARKEKT